MWNIINFETLRALKKKSFWIASIAPLLLIIIVIGVEYFSTKNATSNAAQQAQTRGPAGPSLSEVLGSAAALPEATKTKKGGSTFDTLNGNVLTR